MVMKALLWGCIGLLPGSEEEKSAASYATIIALGILY